MEQYEASTFGEIFNTTLNGTRTTGMSRWLFKLLGGYLYVVALIGILANGTSLFIFCKTSRLRTPINMLVVGLLFADLTRSIFGIPLAASSTYAGHWLWGFPVCIFQGIVVYFCGLSSMYILMTISIHRYFLVIKQINITMVTYNIITLLFFLWIVLESHTIFGLDQVWLRKHKDFLYSSVWQYWWQSVELQYCHICFLFHVASFNNGLLLLSYFIEGKL